jgi:hypothetical protein
MAMSVYEFAKMLSESTGIEVRGFQGFRERLEEKEKIEGILAEHGTAIDLDGFLAGDIKPAGLLVLYLDGESAQTTLYEMSAEVSENWRNRAKTAGAGDPKLN